MAIDFNNFYACLATIASDFRNVNGLCGTKEPVPASVWGNTPGGISGGNIHCLDKMLTQVQGRVGTSYPELMSGGNYSVSSPLYQLQTSLPGAVSGALSYFQSLAAGLVMDIVNKDNFIPNLTIDVALREVVRQMVAQGTTVHLNTLSATVTAGGSNIGNPIIVVTFTDANGNALQYAYNETIVFQTTLDASDGATLGQETISATAPAGQVPPSLNYLWPSGNGYCSGYSGTFIVVDPTQSNGSGGNLLNNSSFKGAWTSNLPANWVAGVGSPGTNWQDGTSNNYLPGAHCFEFLGDGATLASIYQNLANAGLTGGSTQSLTTETVYNINLYYKLSAANPATGILAFTLKDGAGNVVNDNKGNANRISVNLANVSDTAYHALNGSLRVPSNIPAAGLRVYLELTTALPSGKNVFVDGIALAQPAQQTYGGIYAGGPYISIFRGSVDTVDFVPNPVYGDRWTVLISNDYNGVIQTWMWQVFNLPGLGLVLPNAAVPTQADSVFQI